MKKLMGSLLVLIAIIALTACGKKVSVDDLQANEWAIESKEKGEPTLLANFSDHLMTFSVDTSSMKSTSSDDLQAMGAEFAKKLVEQFSYKVEYTLKDDKLTLKADGKNQKKEATYTVSKEDKTIVLTPDQSNDSANNEKMILQPHQKEKSSSSTKK